MNDFETNRGLDGGVGEATWLVQRLDEQQELDMSQSEVIGRARGATVGYEKQEPDDERLPVLVRAYTF